MPKARKQRGESLPRMQLPNRGSELLELAPQERGYAAAETDQVQESRAASVSSIGKEGFGRGQEG